MTMRQPKPAAPFKQSFNTLSTEDDDNRIDWSRKTIKKVRHEDEELLLEEEVVTQANVEEDSQLFLETRTRRPRKDKRDKRRQLVMDEESGRVFVKRRRKRHQYDDWSDDYE